MARRRGRELRLVPLDEPARARALSLAAAMVAATASLVGAPRQEVDAAVAAIPIGPRDHRLRDGLAKLVADRCTFDASEEADPAGLRRDVFSRASAARSALEPGASFDRQALLAEVARERGVSVQQVERGLFADLRSAHRLTAFDAPAAADLVAAYERSQAQAILLRAVKVTADIRQASAEALRTLFRRLKFLRLLHTISPGDGGVRVVIDGPFSLFESVTKYGLQLALALPAIEACGAFDLQADVRWGKAREPLLFRTRGEAPQGPTEDPGLPPEVRALTERFTELDTPWNVEENRDVLELPGVGLCVPDLVFERRRPGGRKPDRVYLEVMGYWSRAAVWKRVELVQAGLGERIVFAVSQRLRVSEEVLDEDLPGALYVYKQAMNARAVADRLDRVAAREHRPARRTAHASEAR